MAAKYVNTEKYFTTHAKKLSARQMTELGTKSKEEIIAFIRQEFYFDPAEDQLRIDLRKLIKRKRSVSKEDELPEMPKIFLKGGSFWISYYDYLRQFTVKKSLQIKLREKAEAYTKYDITSVNFWTMHPKANKIEKEMLERYLKLIIQRVQIRTIFDRTSKDKLLFSDLKPGNARNGAFFMLSQMQYQSELEEMEIARVTHRLDYIASIDALIKSEKAGHDISLYRRKYIPYDTSNFKTFKKKFLTELNDEKKAKVKRKQNANRKNR